LTDALIGPGTFQLTGRRGASCDDSFGFRAPSEI
jgi:hypothetical protein